MNEKTLIVQLHGDIFNFFVIFVAYPICQVHQLAVQGAVANNFDFLLIVKGTTDTMEDGCYCGRIFGKGLNRLEIIKMEGCTSAMSDDLEGNSTEQKRAYFFL